MAEPKTKLTRASVADFIDALPDEQARAESRALVKLLRDVTKAPPRLWGTSIVGFGLRPNDGAKGSAEWPLIAFSPRKSARVVYLAGLERQKVLLAKLGPYKAGKGCLHLRSLEDVDMTVLKALCVESVRLVRTPR